MNLEQRAVEDYKLALAGFNAEVGSDEHNQAIALSHQLVNNPNLSRPLRSGLQDTLTRLKAKDPTLLRLNIERLLEQFNEVGRLPNGARGYRHKETQALHFFTIDTMTGDIIAVRWKPEPVQTEAASPADPPTEIH